MIDPRLEQFGKLLTELVRDMAVRECDRILLKTNTVGARSWKELGDRANDVANVVVPDMVDTMMCALLYRIDAGSLRLKFVADDGEEINLWEVGNGELVGWYIGGDESWRHLYSKQRFISPVGGGNGVVQTPPADPEP